MAPVIVLSTFGNPQPYSDPNTPQVYGVLYDEERYTYDRDAPDQQPVFAYLNNAYDDYQGTNGAPANFSFAGEVHARCLPGTTTRRAYLHNGDGTVRAEEDPSAVQCGTNALALVAVSPFPAAPGQSNGRVQIEARGGNLPLMLTTPDGVSSVPLVVSFDATRRVTVFLPPLTYSALITDSGTPAQRIGVSFTIPGLPVAGCADPDADNYDPLANPVDNTLCVFSPKLSLDPLPDLRALGRPCLVTLHSAAIQPAAPAAAAASLVVNNPPVGAVVTVNGYRFTAGPGAGPGFFTSPDSLLAELRAVPELAAAYQLQLDAPEEIGLIARRPGTAYNLTLTASTTAGLAITLFNQGQNTYHSERRAEWGCWLEVYACPGTPFGPGQGGAKSTAQLAGSFESRTREDNAYTFDVAECLRQFTALDYAGSQALTGYFLRFGETYADVAGGFRRRKQAGESSVLFGLDAVEIVPPSLLVDGSGVFVPAGFPYELPLAFGQPDAGTGTLAGYRRLSRRPGLAAQAGLLTSVLNPTYGGNLGAAVIRRLVNGVEAGQGYALGGFGQPGLLQSLPAAQLSPGPDVERATVTLAGQVVVAAGPVPEGSFTLTFANGQGGREAVAFSGLRVPQAKRSTSLYQTATGRRTYQAELPDSYRLYSGLLLPAVYEWLVAELGNSPAVWLETGAGPVPVNLIDFDASANPTEGEYSLSVEVEPCEQPARGVTN